MRKKRKSKFGKGQNMLFVRKSSSEIFGMDGINRGVAKEVLQKNGLTKNEFEVLFAKSIDMDGVIGVDEKKQAGKLVEEIKKEYSEALQNHNRNEELKLGSYRQDKKRTEKAQSALFFDIRKLVSKYKNFVGSKNHLGFDPEPDANPQERKVLNRFINLIQAEKEKK